jgi:hypothetical protein
MQIIQFPRRPKPAAPPSAVHGQFRSKNVLLEAAWASCVNQTDAIFVLIEAHRNAWHQWAQAVPFEDHPAGEAEMDRRADIKSGVSASPVDPSGRAFHSRRAIGLNRRA